MGSVQKKPHKSIWRLFKSNFTGQKGMAEHLKVLKEGKLQPRIVYPAQLSFRIEKEINNFSDKQKLKTFIAIKSAL